MVDIAKTKCVHCGRELDVYQRRFNPWLQDWECKVRCDSELYWYAQNTTSVDGVVYINTDKALKRDGLVAA